MCTTQQQFGVSAVDRAKLYPQWVQAWVRTSAQSSAAVGVAEVHAVVVCRIMHTTARRKGQGRAGQGLCMQAGISSASHLVA